eukprot:CAMPEP_0206407620 /NCGR_PEP_ID=MMETSP0294-20121207/30617_1 /ASSEMBLY_ACC=CAM_ASM_000327 /TAXON_ID=39354 /ORGANISM="Heterosigma akashiwo, Strain CCMP2393" /LENGTH=431 /DNA_ID=CAMNT_0053866833 /DNA_START=80 /DNA_END=1371 /DNA_ORIENTATION=-
MEGLPLNRGSHVVNYLNLEAPDEDERKSGLLERSRLVGRKSRYFLAALICVVFATLTISGFKSFSAPQSGGTGDDKHTATSQGSPSATPSSTKQTSDNNFPMGEQTTAESPPTASQLSAEELAQIPFKTREHPLKPSSFWGNHRRPFPTGANWFNIGLGGEDPEQSCAVAQPYAMKVGSRGVIITNPTAYRVVNRNAISDGCGEDIVVGSVSNFTSASIRDWDALSVSVNFNLGRGQSSYTTYLVDGSPFVATEYNAARPNLLRLPLLLPQRERHPLRGGPAREPRVRGHHLPHRQDLHQRHMGHLRHRTPDADEAGALHAAEEYTGTVMVAACMEDETCSFLRPFVNAYVVGGEVDMEVDGDTATLIYRYASKGEGEPLMLAAPHHMEYLEAPRVPLSHQFLSSKGKLTGVVAQEWRMQLDLPTISWRAP